MFFAFILKGQLIFRKQSGREREGGGVIRKGPQARIQTWDARSAMTLFVGTLPKKAIGTNVSSGFVEYFALLALLGSLAAFCNDYRFC